MKPLSNAELEIDCLGFNQSTMFVLTELESDCNYIFIIIL